MTEKQEQMMDQIAMLKEQVELLKQEILSSNRYDIIYDKCEVINGIAADIQYLRMKQEPEYDSE